MDTKRRIVAIDEVVSLIVDMAGEGENVILLPGLGCSTRVFHLLIPHLVENHFGVIAINPRGISGSTGSLNDLTLHDLAADVAGVITSLGVAPVHIMGWAFGNRVARCVASETPNAVKTVVLLAAGGQVPPTAEAQQALVRLVKGAHDTKDDRLRDLALALLARNSDHGLGDWVDIGCWPEATTAQLNANRATQLMAWWSGGSKPMLVIQGLEDQTAPPANGHALQKAFSNRVQLVDLADAGHAMMLEHPKTVADIVAGWIHERGCR